MTDEAESGNTRKRLSRICRRELRDKFARVDQVLNLFPEREYFPGWEKRDFPDFKVTDAHFDPVEAWWLAELCLLAYTPDSKEFTRLWNVNRPDRHDLLAERTPLRETLDVHKTSNHASIFEIGESGKDGTILCFRGTCKLMQWITNLVFHRHEWSRFRESDEFAGALVHAGFYVAFKRIWPLIWPTLRLSPRPWIFTGHSLGGALAVLANAVVKADKVYTFGAPRVGNTKFAESYLDNTIRIVNDQDIVPLLPGRRKRDMTERNFNHGGELIWLDPEGEPYEDSLGHLLMQPWERLNAWNNRQPEFLTDHFMVNYCRKLAKDS